MGAPMPVWRVWTGPARRMFIRNNDMESRAMKLSALAGFTALTVAALVPTALVSTAHADDMEGMEVITVTKIDRHTGRGAMGHRLNSADWTGPVDDGPGPVVIEWDMVDGTWVANEQTPEQIGGGTGMASVPEDQLYELEPEFFEPLAVAAHPEDDPEHEDETSEGGEKDGKDDEERIERDPDWPEPRRDCINARLLRDFSVIDRRHAIFYESPRRPYLVTFQPGCFNLRFAFTIATRTRTGRLCGGAGDYIFVDRERCFVRSIERVASKEQARYLVQEREEERQRKREERRNSAESNEAAMDAPKPYKETKFSPED